MASKSEAKFWISLLVLVLLLAAPAWGEVVIEQAPGSGTGYTFYIRKILSINVPDMNGDGVVDENDKKIAELILQGAVNSLCLCVDKSVEPMFYYPCRCNVVPKTD